MRFIVAVLFSTIVVRSTQAQLPMAASDLSRWLDYQEKLNQSRDEMDLRSRMESRGIPREATISVSRLRHTPPGKALKALQRGLKLDAAGDAAGSAEAFRRALEFDPEYAEAHTDLGVEYLNMGLVDDAIAKFRTAAGLDPATSVHHANLGLALMILGLFSRSGAGGSNRSGAGCDQHQSPVSARVSFGTSPRDPGSRGGALEVCGTRVPGSALRARCVTQRALTAPDTMPYWPLVAKVLIAGGGLAGLAAAAALGGAGFEVRVFEARPFLGGRATSYPVPGSPEEPAETIDNCQHILLRCCVNLLDFYQRLGVRRHIRFHREFYFIEPGGRVSVLRRGRLPAPFHFTGSFARLSFLDNRDKLAIARGLLALRRERTRRDDLDRITMLEWLHEKRQTPRAIERFWRQVLVSAVNEDLDRMAARHGFQVFWLGFLARPDSYEMGVPAVPLAELYSAAACEKLGRVQIHLRSPVERIGPEGFVVDGRLETAEYYVCALPFERLEAAGLVAPPLEHSPITGVHLWFDREVTALPHATLLDRTMQWMFNKNGGRYLQLVVSASRQLTGCSRSEIIDLAVADLAVFFPKISEARLVKAHVVKEQRATFSAAPKTESLRPGCNTAAPNLFLAGDWTRTGWPATMEGAVRGGYLAAEAVARAAGRPARFLLPDLE